MRVSKPDSEVMHLHLVPGRWTIQFDQGSIASALRTIYGHKRMPRQGTFVGARLTREAGSGVRPTFKQTKIS